MSIKVKALPSVIAIYFFNLTTYNLSAITRYVSLNGGHDTASGYTNWAGAATTIQAAIIVSAAGDWIWVSNGIYDTGVTTAGGINNRVAITTAVTVASWQNDRSNTIIKGDVNIRPVYMASGARLFGFTVTNGNIANIGGGIYCVDTNAIVSNCLISGNMGTSGGGAGYGYLIDCDIIGNQATHGGGIYGATTSAPAIARRCNIIGNRAEQYGGGVRRVYVYDSLIMSNSAGIGGGGGYSGDSAFFMTNTTICHNNVDVSSTVGGGAVYQYTLYNCIIYGNTALIGGGVHSCYLTDNCQIYSNRASGSGGGMYYGNASRCLIRGNYAVTNGGGVFLASIYALTNCLIIGNEAGSAGGGVWGANGANLYNCTIVGNAAYSFGGTRYVTNYNSIIWSNRTTSGAENGNYTDFYSCGPGFSGIGSISSNPQFIALGSGYGTNHIFGDYHLLPSSPCINTGTNQPWMATITDLDGRPRIDRLIRQVDMGCYEHSFRGTLINLR